jgi:hypothetical protein
MEIMFISSQCECIFLILMLGPRLPDQECKETGGCAWKTIGVTYSHDNGRTWTDPEVIITSAGKRPEKPSWGGVGDFCVVRVSHAESQRVMGDRPGAARATSAWSGLSHAES